MPTSTFFRLDQDKQTKILNAAKEEFTKVPLEEASIANIVKSAEIPRGSFYQYFSGKEDVFYYLFEQIRKEPEETFIRFLEETKGDLFQAFNYFFIDFSKEVLEGENQDFFKNIFLHMNYTRTSQMMMKEMTEEERQAHEEHIKRHQGSNDNYQKIIDLIDKDKLTIASPREFNMLFHQLWSMLFHTINEGYRMRRLTGKIDFDVLKEDYYLRISWLQHGVAK